MLDERSLEMQFHPGDYIIPMGQVGDYYTMTVLDPRGPDSFFVWNFFDEILQQKEWFSPYEESAKRLLDSNPDIKYTFEQKKIEDDEFASDPIQQLYYLYKLSENYEEEHMRYPVYRID